jgi:hypothetical protein
MNDVACRWPDRVMARQGRHAGRFPLAAVLLCWLLLPTASVWGDYLVTLRSGLQLRVQTYTIDGASIQLWTESGSMRIPLDVVRQIAKNQGRSPHDLQPSPAPQALQPHTEDMPEPRVDQPSHRSLHFPDESGQPQ